jgi:hypothetical protein
MQVGNGSDSILATGLSVRHAALYQFAHRHAWTVTEDKADSYVYVNIRRAGRDRNTV